MFCALCVVSQSAQKQQNRLGVMRSGHLLNTRVGGHRGGLQSFPGPANRVLDLDDLSIIRVLGSSPQGPACRNHMKS